MEKEKLVSGIKDARLIMEFVSYLDSRGCVIRSKFGFTPKAFDLLCDFMDIDKEELLNELNNENHEGA